MQDLGVSEDTIYLGVDGGGTKCRAILTTADRRVIGTGVAGPANPFLGQAQAIDSIRTATDAAISDAGLHRDDLSRVVAGIGLAGLNLPEVHAATADWQHPFAHMFMTTDLEVGCYGAHDGGDGAIIVVGTGSSGCAIVGGKSLIISAYGFMFGDICGGAWIGVEAIRAVLLANDGLGEKTSLTEAVDRSISATGNAIVEKMANARPSELARLAGLVFEAADAGDAVATEIIRRGAKHVDAVAARLWQAKPPAMSILGGLRELIVPWLDKETASKLTPPKYSPEIGAVVYAQHKYRKLLEAA